MTVQTSSSDKKLTPQGRVNLHSKSLDNRLSAVHTALQSINDAIITLSESISDLQTMSTNIPPLIADSLVSVKKKINNTFTDLESKLKYQSGSFDSVHTKINLLAAQMNENNSQQNAMNETVLKMFDMIMTLNEKVEAMGNSPNDEISDEILARRLSTHTLGAEQTFSLTIQESEHLDPQQQEEVLQNTTLTEHVENAN